MNSRDKQQGEPEICRESVTIPMVQEVYGSQPQIRAGIGPTEPVRQMSEVEQELVKDLSARVWMNSRDCSPTEARSLVRQHLLPIIRDYVRQQSAPDALLELAIEMGDDYRKAQHRFDVGCATDMEIPEKPTPDDVRKRFVEVKGR